MQPMRLAVLPILALSIVLAACSNAPGKIQGDVYLAEDVDDIKNLAGTTIHLVWEGERASTQIDSALGGICPTRNGAMSTPAAREQAWRERARILRERTVRTVATDARARFAVDSVPPGRYRLWADTVVDGDRWTWLHRVRMNPGDSVEADLNNGNHDDNPFRCVRF